MAPAKARKEDARRFLQIADRPSRGVELSTGQGWIGIDQQVGHGSADALFALTDAQYAWALEHGGVEGGFEGEAWRGEHPDKLLFHPARGGDRPSHWSPSRARMLNPDFEGEIWRHLDALGEPAEGERTAISQGLGAGGATHDVVGGSVRRIELRLVGDDAYPRPAAIIAGLAPGSDRAAARAILGEPIDEAGDEHRIEGVRVLLEFGDGGLAGITLELPVPRPTPTGSIRTFLAALGTPERGVEFQALARLLGGRSLRWSSGSGHGRRVIAFERGADVHVHDGRVVGASIRLQSNPLGAALPGAAALIADVATPMVRAAVHETLGAPDASRGHRDLYRLERGVLVLEYGLTSAGEAVVGVRAVQHGEVISDRFHRWRAGTFTLFLDILGRAQTDALVEYAGTLPGVRLRMRSGAVAAVELSGRGAQLASFVDGLADQPRRSDIPFGAPVEYGRHDDLWSFAQGWVHVRSDASGAITSIRVSTEDAVTPGLQVRPWRFGRDSMEAWRALGR